MNTHFSLRKTLSTINTFNELHSTVASSCTYVSFWGGRYIKVPEYKDPVSIYLLTDFVLRLIRLKEFKFSSDERHDGKALSLKISQLYRQSDELIRQACLLTKIFACLRDIWSRYYHRTRYLWQDCENTFLRREGPFTGYCDVFDYYTIADHQKEFGRPPQVSWGFNCPDSSCKEKWLFRRQLKNPFW